MPLHMRVPKLKGFKNPFRVEYQAVNLDTVDATGLDEVGPDQLHAKGLCTRVRWSRCSGRGEIRRSRHRPCPRVLQVGRGSDHRCGRYG